MSEYCSQCSPFKEEQEWDIDLTRIALNLKKEHSTSFICEGCNNRGIYKDENGLLFLAKKIDGEIQLVPANLEEL